MINNQPNVPHGEGVKAKNKKRRTRACIYARDPQTRSPAENARQLLLAEPTNRATSCTFLSTHDSLDGTLPKGSPRCRQLARVFRARTHMLHRKRTTIEQPEHDGESRSDKKPRTRHERSDTHRHFVAGGALCRRGVYERQEKKESGRRAWEQKNPSQHEVVRDGRRVTDGIRTHDIQNHNLTL